MATIPEIDQAQPEQAPQPTTTQRRIEEGLVSALSSKNPVLALARKEGERGGFERGLGKSSYSARASQGEAMKYVTPLVTEAVKLESQLEESERERTFAGGEAGKAREFQASEAQLGREFTGGEAERVREFTAGETLKEQQAQARELELNRAFQASEAQLGRELTESEAQLVREQQTALQESQIVAQEEIQQAEIAFKETSQLTDIEYRKWLEETTFGHEQLLAGDRQAADAYKVYLDGITQIYSNPDSTTRQKEVAALALQSGARENLELIAITTGLDLSTFLPAAGGDGGGAGVASELTPETLTQLGSTPANLQSLVDMANKHVGKDKEMAIAMLSALGYDRYGDPL